ncbi:MAG: metallophosphoesterase family protein [Candidatus Aureabacteria bacterium]|nr:metallophosphoesterase family protein [Candidatus Auribacterota bacterium]
MRYALISDIHGNTDALHAVLADIEKSGADKLLCLGDIVGYGAEPEECLREVRSEKIDTIQGNHDSATVGTTPLEHFNEYAKEAVLWTAARLGAEDKKYLRDLPLTRDYGGFTIVHSSLDAPHEWHYIVDMLAARRCFELLTERICFIGHSHVPLVFTESGSLSCGRESEIAIREDARYIINIGSVGQPRDGDSRASYGFYDTEAMRVEIRRVPYDIRSVQIKIESAGLPRFLAFRLGIGR